MRYIILILAALLSLASLSTSAMAAEQDWEIEITVAQDSADNRLSLGHRGDATMQPDAPYDVPAMLNGDVMAYFMLGQKAYWRDLRGPDCHKTGVCKWQFYAKGKNVGGQMTVSRDPTRLPGTGRFYLHDPISKRDLDMRQTQAVKFLNRGVVRKFVVLWYRQ